MAASRRSRRGSKQPAGVLSTRFSPPAALLGPEGGARLAYRPALVCSQSRKDGLGGSWPRRKPVPRVYPRILGSGGGKRRGNPAAHTSGGKPAGGGRDKT